MEGPGCPRMLVPERGGPSGRRIVEVAGLDDMALDNGALQQRLRWRDC
jgi:hypothetical protein